MGAKSGWGATDASQLGWALTWLPVDPPTHTLLHCLPAEWTCKRLSFPRPPFCTFGMHCDDSDTVLPRVGGRGGFTATHSHSYCCSGSWGPGIPWIPRKTFSWHYQWRLCWCEGSTPVLSTKLSSETEGAPITVETQKSNRSSNLKLSPSVIFMSKFLYASVFSSLKWEESKGGIIRICRCLNWIPTYPLS